MTWWEWNEMKWTLHVRLLTSSRQQLVRVVSGGDENTAKKISKFITFQTLSVVRLTVSHSLISNGLEDNNGVSLPVELIGLKQTPRSAQGEVTARATNRVVIWHGVSSPFQRPVHAIQLYQHFAAHYYLYNLTRITGYTLIHAKYALVAKSCLEKLSKNEGT